MGAALMLYAWLLLLTGAITFVVLFARKDYADAYVAAFFVVLKAAGWSLFFAGLLAFMLFIGGPVGFVLWLTTPGIALMILARYRDSERRSLLWSLGTAAEKGISLASAARSFADERSDGLGRRARALARALDLGLPLDAALEASGHRLATDAVVAVRTGCQNGNLGPALKAAASYTGGVSTAINRLAAQVVYLVMYGFMAASIIVFTTYKIVPELVKIFEGYGTRLPRLTILTVNFEYFLVNYPAIGIGIMMALGVLLIYAFARYTGLSYWDPPLVRRLSRRLDEAIVLRTIGLGVERERSLSAILESLARAFPKPHVQAQLVHAQKLVEQGMPWCDSLVTSGLLGVSEASVLTSAERVGNLRWALGEVADTQLRRFAARLTTVQSLTLPVIVFAAATVVFAMAALVFLPLIQLIMTQS